MCSNKTELLNLSFFNMATGINESKALQNTYRANINVDLMVEYVNQKSNNGKNLKEHHMCKNYYICNHATCSCKNC